MDAPTKSTEPPVFAKTDEVQREEPHSSDETSLRLYEAAAVAPSARPGASSSAVVDLPGMSPVKITFVTPTSIHIESLDRQNPAKENELRSLMIVTPDSSRESVHITKSKNGNERRVSSSALTVSLSSPGKDSVKLTVSKANGDKIIDNWQLNQKANTATLTLRNGEHIYGFGDKREAIDQRGNTLEMLNHDALLSQDNDSYKSVPFFRSSNGYGLFFHTYRPVTFDVGETKANQLKIDAKGGKLDFYLFAGSDPKNIISEYTELTGRPAMLAKWAFGYHQGKASYDGNEGLEVAKNMRAKELPFDTIFYDDPAKQLTSKQFVDEMRDRYNARLTIGGNPFFIGDSACRQAFANSNFLLLNKDGKPAFETEKEMEDERGPGPNASYVDFFNSNAGKEFIKCELKNALDLGIQFGMADFGELDHLRKGKEKFWPSLGRSTSAEETRNIFSLYYADAMIKGVQELTGQRSTGMIRPGTAGTQRYGWTTTGDSEPTWSSFRAHTRALVSLSNTGFSNIGNDIGGWLSKGPDDIYARWFAAGTFNPFMWSHGQEDHEPYSHGKSVEAVAKSFLALRYKMIPYLYSLQDNANRTGVPMVRSLSLEHPQDEQSAKVDDQFYLGDGMMVAPVMDPNGRKVYLPKGTWYDFFGDQTAPQQSGVVNRSNVPLDRIPVYVRAGSIIPMGPEMQYTGEKPTSPLTIHYYAHEHKEIEQDTKVARFQLYEDDGSSLKHQQGEFQRTDLRFEQSSTRLKFTATDTADKSAFQLPPADRILSIHGSVAKQVTIAGVAIPHSPIQSQPQGAHWKEDGKGGTTVFIPHGHAGEVEITTK